MKKFEQFDIEQAEKNKALALAKEDARHEALRLIRVARQNAKNKIGHNQ